MGSYAVVELGFLGTYSTELRWAFTTRIALLIFAVPALLAVGRPLDLLVQAGGDGTAARVATVMRWRLVRLFGNAVFATIFIAVVFCVFLTPLAWTLRGTPWIAAVLGVAVPLLGLAMVVPLFALTAAHTGLFITIEFLLAFVELLIDSIPGILLRLTDAVVDHAPTHDRRSRELVADPAARPAPGGRLPLVHRRGRRCPGAGDPHDPVDAQRPERRRRRRRPARRRVRRTRAGAPARRRLSADVAASQALG